VTWFHPGYLFFVGLSVLIALAFPVTRHMREAGQRQQYYVLQGITLLGAVTGAKLSMLFGDLHWPWVPVTDWSAILSSGRSITGALILGFLFAELAKPIMGYRMPPNDRFATVLPFTIAIGRLGCLAAGCCQGTPYDGWCAIHGADGIMRHPAPVYELVFQIVTGICFVVMVKRQILYGRLFSLYLVVYGAFRFVTEFVRETPKFYGGYSGYQALALVMMALGGAFFLKRTLAPPPEWGEFKRTTEAGNGNGGQA
jgi:phosphatidylglycerol:prolipoprotein diacylglycerol transferase